ncbi:hypothetical protein AAMO2058_001442400 [Amorphochlora amoebiformis]
MSGDRKEAGAGDVMLSNEAFHDLFEDATRLAAGSHSGVYATRPFVTLTYAQSLDACIARERGKPLLLSGKDSMLITHKIRACHEAILVGVGTVIADNPSLTTRLVQGASPRPIVLDSTLRTPLTSKILNRPPKEAPILVCSRDRLDNSVELKHRAQALEKKGALILRCECCSNGRINIRKMLRSIRSVLGIRSIMVEGGAQVIRGFLSETQRVVVGCGPTEATGPAQPSGAGGKTAEATGPTRASGAGGKTTEATETTSATGVSGSDSKRGCDFGVVVDQIILTIAPVLLFGLSPYHHERCLQVNSSGSSVGQGCRGSGTSLGSGGRSGGDSGVRGKSGLGSGTGTLGELSVSRLRNVTYTVAGRDLLMRAEFSYSTSIS